MSFRDEQGGRQECGGPVPGLQYFPAQPPPCQGGAFSSFNSSARMMAPVLTQTMGCNPLVTSIQWVQPVFANQIKEHRLCCSVKLWMRVCHLFDFPVSGCCLSRSRFTSLSTWIFEHCEASSGAFTWDSRSLDFRDRLLRHVFLAHLIIQSRNAPQSW